MFYLKVHNYSTCNNTEHLKATKAAIWGRTFLECRMNDALEFKMYGNHDAEGDCIGQQSIIYMEGTQLLSYFKNWGEDEMAQIWRFHLAWIKIQWKKPRTTPPQCFLPSADILQNYKPIKELCHCSDSVSWKKIIKCMD